MVLLQLQVALKMLIIAGRNGGFPAHFGFKKCYSSKREFVEIGVRHARWLKKVFQHIFKENEDESLLIQLNSCWKWSMWTIANSHCSILSPDIVAKHFTKKVHSFEFPWVGDNLTKPAIISKRLLNFLLHQFTANLWPIYCWLVTQNFWGLRMTNSHNLFDSSQNIVQLNAVTMHPVLFEKKCLITMTLVKFR